MWEMEEDTQHLHLTSALMHMHVYMDRYIYMNKYMNMNICNMNMHIYHTCNQEIKIIY